MRVYLQRVIKVWIWVALNREITKKLWLMLAVIGVMGRAEWLLLKGLENAIFGRC